jgi:hypothetical protein
LVSRASGRQHVHVRRHPEPDSRHALRPASLCLRRGRRRRDSIYFSATNGGDAGLGQIWVHDPQAQTLTLLFESADVDVLDAPDNLTVTPSGGLIICEDGAGMQLLRGISPSGEIFDFAKNIHNNIEFAGPVFSPDGRTLVREPLRPAGDAHVRHRRALSAAAGAGRCVPNDHLVPTGGGSPARAIINVLQVIHCAHAHGRYSRSSP